MIVGVFWMAVPADGTTAVLLSDIIVSGQTKHCMEFYYHMYGHDVGSLNVYVRNQERNKILIWSQSGNHGNKWRRGFIHIQETTFQIMISATGTAGVRKNIGLDDIRMAECTLFCKSLNNVRYISSITITIIVFHHQYIVS